MVEGSWAGGADCLCQCTIHSCLVGNPLLFDIGKSTDTHVLCSCIHAYLALLTLIDFIDRPRHCPHCECDLYSRTPDAAPGFSHAQVSRGVYSSLHGVDHQAVERPSVDSDADEDARLLGDEESRVGLVQNIVPVPMGGSGKDEIKVEVV